MGLFKVFTDVVTMPIRIAVDVVKIPVDAVNGDVPLKNTRDGIKKIEQDLNED